MLHADSYQDCTQADPPEVPEEHQLALAAFWVANPQSAVGPRWEGDASSTNYVEAAITALSDDTAPLLAALVAAQIAGDTAQTMRLAGEFAATVRESLYQHSTEDACYASEAIRRQAYDLEQERAANARPAFRLIDAAATACALTAFNAGAFEQVFGGAR